MKILIANGADINCTESTNMTALRLAIMTENENVVKILLEHGIDWTLKGSTDSPNLHQAIDKGNLQDGENDQFRKPSYRNDPLVCVRVNIQSHVLKHLKRMKSSQADSF